MLVENLQESAEINNKQRNAETHRLMSNLYYVWGKYDLSIEHAILAYEGFKFLGQTIELGFTGHDLAEALLTMGRAGEAYPIFEQAQQISQDAGNDELQENLDNLQRQYAELRIEQNEDLFAIIGYVRQHGSINRQECMGVCGKSGTQANRYFNTLIESDILERSGKGPSVKYSFIL